MISVSGKAVCRDELTYIENKLMDFLKERLSNVNKKFPGTAIFRKFDHAATFYYCSGSSNKPRGMLYLKFGYNLFYDDGRKEIFVSTLGFNTKNKREDGIGLLDVLNEIAQKFEYEIISFEADYSVQGWTKRLRLPQIVDIFPKEFNKVLLDYKNSFTEYNF